ncbi:hypothetical protein FGL86_11325 [Pistricoccus aurantiacus]|uniref:GNAT family N-acetyltransferase n=1 Tax=Pistricoccus aurantiacus TaxID=1883414 RepID=A0A5B8STF5_9GAMM|nr:hypothetical protein [Pistricoccus aurantiacus]QEA39604.1 hypothetical protein FGL86_11325 [Pistricoccus aurantiacus]
MKVVHVKNEQQCNACLARLCAEVYGHEAGIAPLVTFAGTIGVLFEQQAARVLALVDDSSRPVALALLVLDEQGESMEVALLTALESETVARPAQQLVKALAEKAPLRVKAVDDTQREIFREAGIQRWFEEDDGTHVGLGPRHPAPDGSDLPRAMHFDEQAVVQAFKRDKELFEGYKKRFLRGLESFPQTL